MWRTALRRDSENEKHEDVQKRAFTGLIEICRAALDGSNFKISGRINSNIDLNIDSVSTNAIISIRSILEKDQCIVSRM